MIKKITGTITSFAAVIGTTYFTALHTELLAQSKPIAVSAAQATVQAIKSVELKKALSGDTAALEAVLGKSSPDTIDQLANGYAGQNLPENITLSCRPLEAEKACLERHLGSNKNAVVSQLGLERQEIQIKNFNAAYHDCKDSLNTDPEIDLDDPTSTYPATVECLVDKGFQAELEQMAQYSSVLKDELAALTAPRKHTMHAAKPTDTHGATEEQETAE